MDKTQEALLRIIDETNRGLSDSRKIRQIMDRIERGKATYADALEYARENSRVMTGSLRRHLPDVLTDGKLYRATAETVVRVPMEENAAQVIEVASEIQEALNAEAGLGIQAIRPEINQDQVDGIITGICNAEDYAGGRERFFEQIENFLEGTVDDCVRENAEFHYQAGLGPKIERRADAKCCSWCSALAGVYDYADVRNGGNDVYRRHRNCHCQVLYNPGDGSARRQNVHSKAWTESRESDNIDRESLIGLNLQQFGGRTGRERAEQYGSEWQKASLWDAVQRFAPGSTGRQSENGVKMYFDSADGTRSVVYDINGNYFRIQDRTNTTQKKYLSLNGQPVANITENGKQRGTHRDEYERMTHFLNID